MTEQGNVHIADKSAFPGKVNAIKNASMELRALARSLPEISAKAREEASSFTSGGAPAPIYAPALEALDKWVHDTAASIIATCDSADNCADSARDKFTALVDIDDRSSKAIHAL